MIFTNEDNQKKIAAVLNELIAFLNTQPLPQDLLPVKKAMTLVSVKGVAVQMALVLSAVADMPEKLRLTLFEYIENGEGRRRLKTAEAAELKLYLQQQLNDLPSLVETIQELYKGLTY